jgi:hypothetical protein
MLLSFHAIDKAIVKANEGLQSASVTSGQPSSAAAATPAKLQQASRPTMAAMPVQPLFSEVLKASAFVPNMKGQLFKPSDL